MSAHTPEELWIRRCKDGSWDWSFDPPLKRHELKFTHMVRADGAAALLAALEDALHSVEHSEFCDVREESDVDCGCGAKGRRLRARGAIAKARGGK